MNPEWTWDNPPADLPQRLAAARAYARLGVGELAEKMKVERNSPGRWEGGDLPKHPRSLESILQGYLDHTGVKAWWFEAETIDFVYDAELAASLDALEDEA